MEGIFVKKVLSLALILLPTALFGLDIYVAPLLYVDETMNNNRNTIQVQTDLLNSLHAVETGIILRFDRLKDNRINPPQSLSDAATVCRNEQIDYLLYGFTTRRAHSVQIEIRLFDYANRSVMQTFFGMDDETNYDRMIQDVSQKIISYIDSVFNLSIIPQRTGFTRISIPFSTGYWTPMSKNWFDVMLGTVTAGSGFELTPTDNLFIINGLRCYLSTGIDVKYRFGMGRPTAYDAYNHTLYMTMPVRLFMRLANQHELFFGLGFVYFMDFFLMADKYSEISNYIYSNIGANANFGYQFRVNDTLSIFFRNDFDFLINEHPLITYSPVIGLNVYMYNKEVKNKW